MGLPPTRPSGVLDTVAKLDLHRLTKGDLFDISYVHIIGTSSTILDEDPHLLSTPWLKSVDAGMPLAGRVRRAFAHGVCSWSWTHMAVSTNFS